MQLASVPKLLTCSALAFFVGYVLYTPIAHGVTGPHPEPLSIDQLIAHTIGLLVVSGLVLSAQLWALEQPLSSNRLRLVLGSVLFVSAFWLGWYTLGPPMNLFSYIVLATAAWVSPRHVVGGGCSRLVS